MSSAHSDRMFYCSMCREYFHSSGIIQHVEKSHMIERDSYICGTCAFEDVSLNKVAHHCLEVNHAIGRIVRPMICWEAKLMQALEAIQESSNFFIQNDGVATGQNDGGGGSRDGNDTFSSVSESFLSVNNGENGVGSQQQQTTDSMDEVIGGTEIIRKDNNINNTFQFNNRNPIVSGIDLADKLRRIKADVKDRKEQLVNLDPNSSSEVSAAADSSSSMDFGGAASTHSNDMMNNSMVDVKFEKPKGRTRGDLTPGPVCAQCKVSVSSLTANGQVNTNALKRHIWIHHFDNVKPFACSGCKMEFSYKSNFNLHLKRKPNHTGHETLVEIVHDLHGKTNQKMRVCFPEYATNRSPKNSNKRGDA